MELARVVDKDALAEAKGPTGRMSICVPSTWLAAGDTIEVTVPRRLSCAVCEGGGCDRCERRGGLRLDDDETARRVRIGLPKRPETSAFVLRLREPLGADAGLEQLVLEITTNDTPTESCTRIEPATPSTPTVPRAVIVGLAVFALLAALAALATR